MDGSMLFDRWQQRVLPWGHIGATWQIRLNLCILRPTRVHNPNGKWIGSAVFHSVLHKVHILYNGRPYPPELPLPMEDVDLPCNTWCFGPMRARPQPKRHLDQFSRVCTDDRRVYLYGLPVSPSKLFLPTLASGPHVIHGSLGPPKSGTQMATWSFQPFLQGSLVWQIDRATDRPTTTLLGARWCNNALTMRDTAKPHSRFMLVRTISSLLSRYLYIQNL